MTNIITACFGGTRFTNTRPAWLIDHGMVLKIAGVELPEIYEVDFSNSKAETATRVLGGRDGVVIPDKYFLSAAQQIYAWVYLTTGDSGFTTLQITIPLSQRPDVSTEPPTPQETDLIEQAIAALNDGVTRAETAADNAKQSATEASAAAENIQQTVDDALQEAKDIGEFDGKDGEDGKDGSNGVTYTPTVDAEGVISWVNDGGLPNPQPRNIKGPAGKDGEVGATPNLTIGTVETLEPGEDATAEITGTPENPVLSLGIPQGEQGEGADTSNCAPVIINSASGDIASFTDGADGLPVKQLTVNVEPIQDLHGYDSPWPGGGGRNKFDVSKMVDTSGITINNGVISVTGNAKNSTKKLSELADLTVGETYILTANTTGTENIIYLYGTGANVIWDFGTSKTITQEMLDALVMFYGGADTTSQISNFMIRLASVSDATFAPYENICPISGHDSVSVWDDPVYGGTIKWNQLLSEDQAVGSYSKFGLTFAMVSGKMGFKVTGTFSYGSGDRNAYIYRQNYPIAIIKDHVYCIAYDSKYATVYCYGASFSGNWTGYAPHGGSIIKSTNSANLNLSLNFGSNISNGTVFNEEILINLFDLTEMFGKEKADEIYALDMQSPRGQGVTWFRSLFPDNYYEQDDSYTETLVSAVNGDPYRHITIQLGDTVYGGTLDVTQGKMLVDRIKHIVNGAEAQVANQAMNDAVYRTGIRIADFAPNATGADAVQVLCNIGRGSSRIFGVAAEIGDCALYTVGGIACVLIGVPIAYNTTAAARQWLIDNNCEFVAKLATPIEITLTPTQINTLLGQNNIWSDAGEVDVDYRADTKLYIDNIHTPTEDDMTADAQIASGKYFLIGGTLYLSTTVIPAGDTIIPGTNCTKTNLADALNALNA